MCTCAAIRFGSVVDDDKEGNLRLQLVPESTKSAINWGISVWKEWVTARSVKAADGRCSVSTPLLAMPVDDFAYWLRKFILETRKKDDTEYPPKRLYGLTGCFKRFCEMNERFDASPLSCSNARLMAFDKLLSFASVH